MTGAWSHFFGKLRRRSSSGRFVYGFARVVAEKKRISAFSVADWRNIRVTPYFKRCEFLRPMPSIARKKTLRRREVVARFARCDHGGLAAQNNLIWRAVATAPPGWCHVKTTMIATRSTISCSRLDFDEIKRKWDAKMHPLKYQRPTTVKEGNLDAANKLIERWVRSGRCCVGMRRSRTCVRLFAVTFTVFSATAGRRLPKAAEQEVAEADRKAVRSLEESADGEGQGGAVAGEATLDGRRVQDVLQHAKSIEYYVDDDARLLRSSLRRSTPKLRRSFSGMDSTASLAIR